MLSDHSQRVDVFFPLTVHVSMSVYSKGRPHGQEPRWRKEATTLQIQLKFKDEGRNLDGENKLLLCKSS